MNVVEHLTQNVQGLSPEDLRQFRAWFLEYDAQCWYQQISKDLRAGKLDKLIAEARADFQAGKARQL